MASNEKAKIQVMKSTNRIANLKDAGSSVTRKAAVSDVKDQGKLVTDKNVNKQVKLVEQRRKLDNSKTLARAKAKSNQGATPTRIGVKLTDIKVAAANAKKKAGK
jgi:hypothetical protein